MNRLKNHSSLFKTAPILVKEWHPSSNSYLTPRSVKIRYPKKVWWLCSDGHEWQATIKARLKNNDCPICEKEATKKKADLSIGLPIMGKNYRKSRRFKTKAMAVIELPDSGYWVYAEMTGFSKNGLCFETEAAILPGTVIRVKLNKSLVSSSFGKTFTSRFNDGYKTYNSTVKRCKQLEDDIFISNFWYRS